MINTTFRTLHESANKTLLKIVTSNVTEIQNDESIPFLVLYLDT